MSLLLHRIISLFASPTASHFAWNMKSFWMYIYLLTEPLKAHAFCAHLFCTFNNLRWLISVSRGMALIYSMILQTSLDNLVSSWLLCQGEGLALPERQNHGQRGDLAGWWQQSHDRWLRRPCHLWQPGLHGRHSYFLREPGTWGHVARSQEWADAELQPDEDNPAQPGGSGELRGRYVTFESSHVMWTVSSKVLKLSGIKGNQDTAQIVRSPLPIQRVWLKNYSQIHTFKGIQWIKEYLFKVCFISQK